MDMTLCINGFRLPQWLSGKESACWAAGSVPGLGRYPGGEYGNPLHRGVWWAAVQRVTKSRTRLKQLMTMHIKGLIWQIHLGPWEEVIWRRWHLVDWHTGPACASPSPLSLECAFCPSFLQWEIFPKTTQAVLREQLAVETIWTVYMLEAGQDLYINIWNSDWWVLRSTCLTASHEKPYMWDYKK